MKKNLRKFENGAQPPREEIPRDDIRYLGFVVDPTASVSNVLTHALVNLEQAADTWYVARLTQHGTIPKPEAALVRYFRTIFFLSVKALLHHQARGQLEESTVILDKNTPKYEKIGGELRDSDRRDKVKGISADFPKLRMAIHNSLFAAHGSRRPFNVIWKGKAKPETIFFWTPQDLGNAGFVLDQDKPIQTVRVQSLIPTTEMAPESVARFAKELISLEHGNSWQDLYRRGVVDTGYEPSPKWLNITSLEVKDIVQEPTSLPKVSVDFYAQRPRLKFTGTPLEFPKAVEGHKNVLLTGPSGSGKTTALRLLVNSWFSEDQELEGQKLCFYIRLESTEKFLEERRSADRKIDISELIGWSVASILEHKCDIKEFENCETVLRLARERTRQQQPRSHTVNEMLDYIQQDVGRWFRKEGCQQSNVIVIADGINELPPRLRAVVRRSIEDLARKPCRVVVSCRSNIASNLFWDMRERFRRFELQELDEQQIIDYIDCRIPSQGKHIFDTQIKIDRRILSMAKNPFYLSLITQRMSKDLTAKIPQTRVPLIESFIWDSIERKHVEGKSTPERLKDDMIYTILPKVAKWSIRMLVSSDEEGVVSFTDSEDFKNIQDQTDVLTTLEMAESYGLLRFSGLLEESRGRRGYPAFSHDNLRDFFAGLYLRSLSKSELLKQLPDIIEYFAWDEALLFFLELCQNKGQCAEVTDFALSKDPLLGGMCARHARIMQKESCLQVAQHVGQLPDLSLPSEILQKILIPDHITQIRSRPGYVLGRFSIPELLDITKDPSDPHKICSQAALAIPANVSVGDYDFLTNAWRNIPKTATIELFAILSGIARIPTEKAFDFFVKAYMSLPNEPEFQLNEVTRLLFNPCIIYFVAYSPSLSQAVDTFPSEQALTELSFLLSKVEKADSDELPLLEKLFFHSDSSIAIEACILLSKTLGENAFVKLVERYNQTYTQKARDYRVFELRTNLLENIAHIRNPKATRFLIEEVSKPHRHEWSSSVFIAGDRSYLLQLLSETRSEEALIALIHEACSDFYPKTTAYCATLLESWSDRNKILNIIRDYHRRSMPNESAELLGACMGGEDFCPRIGPILEDWFAKTVLGKIGLPPSHTHPGSLYDELHPEFHFEKTFAMLPLAVRAARRIPCPEVAGRLLDIIKWQFSGLKDPGFGVQHWPWKFSCDLVAECLETLTVFTSDINAGFQRKNPLLGEISDDLINVMTAEETCSLFKDCRPRVIECLTKVCETLLEEDFANMFSTIIQTYKQNLKKANTDNSDRWGAICELLVGLCNQASDEIIVDFLKYLQVAACDSSIEYRNMLFSLAQAIKLVWGRRFLVELSK